MANRIVLFFLISVLIAFCAKQSDTGRPPKDAAVSTPTKAEEQGPYRIDVDTTVEIGGYIRNMLEDSQGNFWFGTNSYGVCRYDGESFTYLNTEHGLGGNQIRGIVEDSAGNLWFATQGGVSRYDGDPISNFTKRDGLSDNDVWGIYLDKAGNLWFGTVAGACRYDGKAFAPFTLPVAARR